MISNLVYFYLIVSIIVWLWFSFASLCFYSFKTWLIDLSIILVLSLFWPVLLGYALKPYEN